MSSTNSSWTVVSYLTARLREIGVETCFGVAGDFVLTLFEEVMRNKIEYIPCCNELNAAFAADGYARLKGVGCFAATYGVGELAGVSGVAGAFAEHVPVVVLVGCPSTDAMKRQPLLHHTLGDYNIPHRMLANVVCASVVLTDVRTCAEEIDRVLRRCIEQQQPCYVAVPTDMVTRTLPLTALTASSSSLAALKFTDPDTDEAALREAVDDAVALLNAATRPVLLVDAEVVRRRMQSELRALVHRTGYPFATLTMGKCALDEDEPQFIGMYMGQQSRPYVRQRVEQSDGVLQLGVLLTDFNSGGFTAQFNEEHVVLAHWDRVRVKHHWYYSVPLRRFLQQLTERLRTRDTASLDIRSATHHCVHKRVATTNWTAQRNAPLTIARVFDRVAQFVPERSVVVADTGSSMFAVAETQLPRGCTFVGQVFYGAIGYSLGATVGCAIAARDRPVVLVVGDGAFQIAAQELSTWIRFRPQRSTLLLLNNDGYTIERFIRDGEFNNIARWRYHMLPEVFGGKRGVECRTEEEFDGALKATGGNELSFVEIHTERMDAPATMVAASEGMRKQNDST